MDVPVMVCLPFALMRKRLALGELEGRRADLQSVIDEVRTWCLGSKGNPACLQMITLNVICVYTAFT